jgi:hypothetical protein
MPPSQPPAVADIPQSSDNFGSKEGTSAKPAIDRISAAQKTATSASEERAEAIAPARKLAVYEKMQTTKTPSTPRSTKQTSCFPW